MKRRNFFALIGAGIVGTTALSKEPKSSYVPLNFTPKKLVGAAHLAKISRVVGPEYCDVRIDDDCKLTLFIDDPCHVMTGSIGFIEGFNEPFYCTSVDRSDRLVKCTVKPLKSPKKICGVPVIMIDGKYWIFKSSFVFHRQCSFQTQAYKEGTSS